MGVNGSAGEKMRMSDAMVPVVRQAPFGASRRQGHGRG